MKLPGLTADASLYRTRRQYISRSSDYACAVTEAPVMPAYLPGLETRAVRSDLRDEISVDYPVPTGLPIPLDSDSASYGSMWPWEPKATGAHVGSVIAASQPAHTHSDSPACLACLDIICGVPLAACLAAAAISAGACGIFYPICFAALEIGCETGFLGCSGSICHARGVPSWLGGTLGPPCCPVVCSSGCCNTGETCAAVDPTTGQNLCCSPGLRVCAGTNCCAADETCLPDGSCCPTANVCGGQNCCSTGETCLPDGSCCPTANVCGGGQTCCKGTCMPDGSCCPPGQEVCGGICCPSPNDVCDPTTNTCTQTCPDGSPTCGGTCCAASETCCNGTCCPSSQACCNGTCCAAGQLCCSVEIPGGWQQQCVTPGNPYNGFAWCGTSSDQSGNQIICNNCPPGQCYSVPLGQGQISTDWYCQ
jgi:hypothetical protein